MAVGTNERLYLLLFTGGNLNWEPEGKIWNSKWRGWELSAITDLAFLTTCLLYRSVRLHCWTPKMLLLTFTILERAVLALTVRLPYQQITENVNVNVWFIKKGSWGAYQHETLTVCEGKTVFVGLFYRASQCWLIKFQFIVNQTAEILICFYKSHHLPIDGSVLRSWWLTPKINQHVLCLFYI